MKKRLNISFSIRTQFYKFDPKPHYEQHTNYIFETLHQKWQLALVENMVCDLQTIEMDLSQWPGQQTKMTF